MHSSYYIKFTTESFQQHITECCSYQLQQYFSQTLNTVYLNHFSSHSDKANAVVDNAAERQYMAYLKMLTFKLALTSLFVHQL